MAESSSKVPRSAVITATTCVEYPDCRRLCCLAPFSACADCAGVFEPANYICVTRQANCRRLVRLLELYWQLPKPELLVTVTGGAQDFTMPPELQLAFDRGMVSVATSAKAWIFTAGSDTGVMRLVGATMDRYQVKFPLIGTATSHSS